MASAGKRAARRALQYLQAQPGLSFNLDALMQVEGVTLPDVGLKQYSEENAGQDLMDRSAGSRYPAIHVYCEKYANTLREKFRTFSGKAQVTVEARVSQDRVEGLGAALAIYMEAVTRVLDQHRGDWGNGMFYGGGYEAAFGAVKHGGRNFVQTGKVLFEVEVSLD
ncbi:MAG: hypothetical protein HYR60_32365 [Acidobacteria bacterium]|nr:hypothetical protein [Acidobacteriota bacterium]MBI3471465.1 hypothetical protein [Candidatus Solibacter usitatus]